MALIGEIRKRSGLLAVVIGLALALFLISDIFSNQNFNFFGDQDDSNPTVLEIDGEKIDRVTFDRIVQQSERVRELNGMTVDDNMRSQLRAEAANQLFNDMAIAPLLKNLGVDIADKEYGELLTGDEPHPFVQQYFQQQYSPEVMRRFLQNEYQNDPKYKAAMDEILRAIKTQVKAEKYNNIVKAGFQATDFDVQNSFNKKETKVSGNIVFANYLTVADSLVEVSEREMQNYLDDHKTDYEVEASRDLEYVEWRIEPSSYDSGMVYEQVKNLKEDFAKAEDDSAFIARYSDLAYNPVFRSHGSFGGEAENELFNAEVGQVVGPIASDNGYGVYKILGKQEGSKKFYYFSQIVLSLGMDSAAVYNKANQLLAEINNGSSFEELARKNSIDPSSVNGGNMGWVADAAFIPPSVIQYNEKNSPGTIGIVRSPAGLHIVKVNARPSSEMVKVANVVRKLEISRETKNEMFGMANNFMADIKTDDELGFTKKAAAARLNVKNATKLAPGARGWSGMNNAREVVKWAYESKRKKGNISEPFMLDNTIMVARLRKVVEKGTSDLESVRDEIKQKVINEKKAEILIKKFKEAEKKTDKKMDPVSLAIAMGTVAQKVENAQFGQNSILYVGNDVKVQGVILGMKKGERTIPVEGDQGVFVFYCNEVSTPPVAPDLASQVDQITNSYKQGIESKIDDVLKKKAGLENMFDKYY